MADLERRIRILTLCTVLSVTSVVLLAAYVMSGQAHGRFSQIDAERLNIIGTNDRPVLVLSNRRLVPGPTMNGREYPRATAEGREFMSGMIFFNEEGDEVGGLIFAGIPRDDGYSAVGHLSFDQWKQNQVVALQYNDNGTSRRAALNVWDRPTDATMDAQLDLSVRMLEATPEERDAMRQQNADARARGDYGVQRLFVGSRDGTAQVQLRDTRGRERIRLFVNEADEARLEFLDQMGEVVAVYPPAPPADEE